MFDQAKVDEMRARVDGVYDVNPWAGMNNDQLRELRREIDRSLPPDDINELNLEQELVAQYRDIKGLMSHVIDDPDTPANQKSQVANAVVATLQQLYKLQEDLRREERLKLIESVLMDILKGQPPDIKDAFFAEYETRAEKAGLM